MAPDNSYEVDLTFTNNTGPAVQGFAQLGAISSEIRKDIDAINAAMDGVNERAEKMRSYYSDNVELISQAKSLLEVTAGIEQGNQAMLTQNLQIVNEILSSVRALGGNTGQAMQMLGAAGVGSFMGGMGMGMGGMMNDPFYGGSPLSPLDFRNSEIGGVPQRGMLSGLSKAINRAPKLFKRFGVAHDEDLEDPTTPINYGGGGGTGGGGGGGTGGAGGGSEECPDCGGIGTHADGSVCATCKGSGHKLISMGGFDPSAIAGTLSSSSSTASAKVRPISLTMRDQIKKYEHVDKLVPKGLEAKASSMAYDLLDEELDTIFGESHLGRQLNKRTRNILGQMGVNKKSINREAQQSYELTGHDPVTGDPIYERTEGIKEGGAEEMTLKASNMVHKMIMNKVISSVSKTLGKVNMGMQALGMAQDVMGAVRNVTGYAQQQGDVFGQTNYGRSAGMAIQAQAASAFNLNPFFSSQDYAQAQMMGAQLGLKGNDLYKYANNSMQLKQNYGLTAQESQQFLGAGLGAGVGMDANMAGIAQLRALENNTNNMSTQYGNQAYVTGMSTGASMGLTGAAAVQRGLNAAQFGAGSQVLQQAGLTGTEGTGTQLMNALTAQQLGVPYMSLYAAESRLKGGKGGNQATMAADKGIMSILANMGINPANIKKQSDLNNYAMELSMVLPQLVGDQKLADPQKAVAWVWGKIQEMNRIQHPTKPKPHQSVLASLWGGVENAVTGVGGFIGTAVKAAGDVGGVVVDETAGILTGQSQDTINNWNRSAEATMNSVQHNWANAIGYTDWRQHGAGAAFKKVGSDFHVGTIEVNVAPHVASSINAVVKHTNDTRAKSGVPLNQQR